jgi:hypothetical protein
MSEETILTPAQLSERYDGVSVKTLANWRSRGTGPVFTKIGGKVFYRLPDVLEWERSRTMRP